MNETFSFSIPDLAYFLSCADPDNADAAAAAADVTLSNAELSLLVQVEVLSGAIEGLYVAEQATMPSASRCVLQQHRLAFCPYPHCDRNGGRAFNTYVQHTMSMILIISIT